MKKIFEDERIYLEVQKVYAMAFKIMTICLLLDFFYNIFIKNESFTDNIDKTIILLITFIYIIIKLVKLGLFNIRLMKNKSDKIYILGTSALTTIFFTIFTNLNQENSIKKVLVIAIIMFICMTSILTLLTKLSQKDFR